MDNRPDIWRRLQDHQTPPPPGAFERLYNTLHPNLSRLQEHPITPPAYLQDRIKKSIRSSAPTRRFYMAAAACLLIIGSLIFIYQKNKSTRTGNRAIAHNNLTPPKPTPPSDTTAARDTGLAAETTADGTANGTGGTADGLADGTSSSDQSATGATDPSAMTRKHSPLTLNINHHSFPLVNNDLLVTLTSYTYPEIAVYINKTEDQALKIHLDQYTNIIISKPLAAMIKTLYETRANGKPTRKARRTKDRFDSWKKADEKHFDGKKPLNPVDPIDLAEFIFK